MLLRRARKPKPSTINHRPKLYGTTGIDLHGRYAVAAVQLRWARRGAIASAAKGNLNQLQCRQVQA
jgi:hypothetical protein